MRERKRERERDKFAMSKNTAHTHVYMYMHDEFVQTSKILVCSEFPNHSIYTCTKCNLVFMDILFCFSDLEHYDECCKVFQMGINSTSDDPEGVCQAMLQFEREHGSLETFETGLEKCSAQLKRVRERREKVNYQIILLKNAYVPYSWKLLPWRKFLPFSPRSHLITLSL